MVIHVVFESNPDGRPEPSGVQEGRGGVGRGEEGKGDEVREGERRGVREGGSEW